LFINHFDHKSDIDREETATGIRKPATGENGDHSSYKITIMKNSLQIVAIIDQPELLEDKIEQLAHRHHDTGYGIQNMPANRIVLETSSIETHITGDVVMNNPDEQISTRFVTCFVFTCVKRRDNEYVLEWSSSLS
jgi:hypothetical protein